MDKQFFENIGLYAKYKFTAGARGIFSLSPPSIQLECPKCHDVRTWVEDPKYRHMIGNRLKGYGGSFAGTRSDLLDGDQPAAGTMLAIEYFCADCRSRINFIVLVDDTYVMKLGQYPPQSITIDKTLERTLGEYVERYKRGLICENQGFGIGAFAYYRRIVEGIIDSLLDSIGEIIELTEQGKYQEALKKTKNSRIAQEKIDLIKEIIPVSFRPGGMNPLGILHQSLSEGLHARDDETCLADAAKIRAALEFLVSQIETIKNSKKTFTEAMQKLLDKK